RGQARSGAQPEHGAASRPCGAAQGAAARRHHPTMSAARAQGSLFRKYLLVLLLLVGGLLTLASLVDFYFSYQEAKRALVRVERVKAEAAAQRIEGFVKEITHHVQAITRAIADDPAVAPPRRRDLAWRGTLAAALTEQREIDFVRLLRSAPSIVEARYLDVAG